MAKVNTLLWDVGGVLLTNGWDHLQRYGVLEYFGVPREPFESVHAELNDSWEKGHITIDEYLGKTVFSQPRDFSQAEFVAKMQEQSVLHPETAIDVLREVSAWKSYVIGMLNNESRELNDYRIATFGLKDYFDCFVSSCYVGLRKPHAEIYKLALDLLQCEAETAVFIDDREANVEAARASGMHGIVHKTAAATAAELRELGIEIQI